MKTQKFFGQTMQEALGLARETYGPNSVIIANKKVQGGVELEVGLQESDATEKVTHLSQVKTINKLLPESVNAGYLQEKQTSDSSMSSDQEELNFLREVFKEQISKLVTDKEKHFNSLQKLIYKKLNTIGITDNIREEIVSNLGEYTAFKSAWQAALACLEAKIKISKVDPLTDGGVYVLVGPTGSGKTTSIAKIANRYVKQNGTASLGLITCDTNRAGAQEQLILYGKALGVPVHVATDSLTFEDTLGELSKKHLVLVDTAGVNHRDKKLLSSQAEFFKSKYDLRLLLTLPAILQYEIFNEIITSFNFAPVAGSLITKIDESMTLSPLLNSVIQNQLPISYFCDGQDISDNFLNANARRLVKLASEIMNFNDLNLID